MKKLRIAYLTPRYYPYVGGVEYVVRNLAEGLALKGHDITVFAGDPQVKKIVKESVNGVEVVRVPTYVFREAYHVPKEKQKIKELLQESFDVVHTNSIHAVFTLLPFDIKKSDKPDWKLVMTYDGKRKELHNIPQDWAEQKNVAEENPAIVEELSEMAVKWREAPPEHPPKHFISKFRK